MAALEHQISEWRDHVGRSRGLTGPDVEELEGHLREQIDALERVGLADDEAFLVAVKRMGAVDTLSHEFAREHSGRLWKQLVLAAQDEPEPAAGGLTSALVFAVLAAVAIQVPRVAELWLDPEQVDGFRLRNAALLVLPSVAAWFALRRGLGRRQLLVTAVPFVLGAALVNGYPWSPAGRRSSSARSRCRSPNCSPCCTCRWCCGSPSGTRSWPGPGVHTSAGWTWSGSPASGSCTTR
ncbi:MAG: hypothetical protein V7637_3978 [Mycobacteriales bacterium]